MISFGFIHMDLGTWEDIWTDFIVINFWTLVAVGLSWLKQHSHLKKQDAHLAEQDKHLKDIKDRLGVTTQEDDGPSA